MKIFDIERKKFERLWHSYHAKNKIAYSFDEREGFFNSMLEIFKEDGQAEEDGRGK